jgi:hypothetical protein
MEFVKFNRVAPIVVDAPDLLGIQLSEDSHEDFDEITTYSRSVRIFVSWTSATLSPVKLQTTVTKALLFSRPSS